MVKVTKFFISTVFIFLTDFTIISLDCTIQYVIRRSSRLKATGFKVLWKLWNAMWKKFPVLPQYPYVDLPVQHIQQLRQYRIDKITEYVSFLERYLKNIPVSFLEIKLFDSVPLLTTVVFYAHFTMHSQNFADTSHLLLL